MYITCFKIPFTAEESSEDEDEETEEVKVQKNVRPKKPVEDDMEVEDGWSVAR